MENKRIKTAKTGEVCPQKGVWRSSEEEPSMLIVSFQGNIMPSKNGKEVSWELTHE